jgi:hypothetical protein
MTTPYTQTWEQAQAWESAWWGDCANTLSEENKQLIYAHRMGLVELGEVDGRWPVYDLADRSVIDVGGGPVSLLLKCQNRGSCVVADPCAVPVWVEHRYTTAGIGYSPRRGESMIGDPPGVYDEAWIYNVLQHTTDPEAVVAGARRVARVLRLFEWVDTDISPGHLHSLSVPQLQAWCGGGGAVENFTGQNGLYGEAFFGVFSGD